MIDPSFQRSTRSRNSSASRRPRSRMPSASAYMATAAGAAAALFFLLWWILQGEDNPWIPAGLAAVVVMLVATSARQIVMRRALQERVRGLQKHHLLAWARDESLALTREAQQRVRLHEKIETANRALDCIDSALKVYPEEEELRQSAGAVHEFITSSRVAHWIELAERAVFKGYYPRAIDCYRDALVFLTRDKPAPDRQAAAERITREIDLLRARLATQRAVDSAPEKTATKRRQSL